jgi:hypothetical protein
MSGAEPWIGSNRPGPCKKKILKPSLPAFSPEIMCVGKQFNVIWENIRGSITDSPTLADASIPMLPVIVDASSDSMSPKILFVTIVSNCDDTGNSVGQQSHTAQLTRNR